MDAEQAATRLAEVPDRGVVLEAALADFQHIAEHVGGQRRARTANTARQHSVAA
jgi:hypothetical protein